MTSAIVFGHAAPDEAAAGTVRTGDILVLRYTRMLDDDDIEGIRPAIDRLTGTGVRVVIIDGCDQIATVRGTS